MMGVAMLGILVSIGLPRVSAVLQRSSARQAAGVVAADLEQAVSLAARQRRPVRLTCNCPAGTYTLSDRTSGTVLFHRVIGGTGGNLALGGLTFSANPIDIFPSGMTSAALTVTLTTGGTSRQVIMSTGGFVRVVQ
jgi:Tfp pilus assembly protein FimT